MFFSVSAAACRGGRAYMEDRMILKHFRAGNPSGRPDSLFLAILDGHGGPQAAEYVKEHLWSVLSEMDGFWSDDDAHVLDAMKNAFLLIHEQMEEARDNAWPPRPNGFASTAGTTCSCALIRNDKIYTAHVGDSRIILLTEAEDSDELLPIDLTHDHKPDDPDERARIEQDGGRVTDYTPVARVAWTREVQVNGSSVKQIESIPFLSIARSLGDYWSYIPSTGKYSVSPVPDCAVREIDQQRDKFLLLITDGITNVLNSATIAEHVDEWRTGPVRNISRCLLKAAMNRWRNLKADNMSVLCLGLHDPLMDEFNVTDSLYVGAPIDRRLTSNPREILLLYPQYLRVVYPDCDDLSFIKTLVDEDDEREGYSGPGYINRSPPPSADPKPRIRVRYSPLRTFSKIAAYPASSSSSAASRSNTTTNARNSLARPFARRAYSFSLRRAASGIAAANPDRYLTAARRSPAPLSGASPPPSARAKIQRLEFAGTRVVSVRVFGGDGERARTFDDTRDGDSASVATNRSQRALSSAPVLVAAAAANEEGGETRENGAAAAATSIRQSWPPFDGAAAIAPPVTTRVERTESRLLARSPSLTLIGAAATSAYRVPPRRAWAMRARRAAAATLDAAAASDEDGGHEGDRDDDDDDELASEEDVAVPATTTRFATAATTAAAKRKRNLERDEIEAKRQNCHV